MKKMKIVLLSAAILLAVGGAFASKKDPSCSVLPQYFKLGLFFFPAGEYGVNYICWDAGGVCTYYRAIPFYPYNYTPCRTGGYFPIF